MDEPLQVYSGKKIRPYDRRAMFDNTSDQIRNTCDLRYVSPVPNKDKFLETPTRKE